MCLVMFFIVWKIVLRDQNYMTPEEKAKGIIIQETIVAPAFNICTASQLLMDVLMDRSFR